MKLHHIGIIVITIHITIIIFFAGLFFHNGRKRKELQNEYEINWKKQMKLMKYVKIGDDEGTLIKWLRDLEILYYTYNKDGIKRITVDDPNFLQYEIKDNIIINILKGEAPIPKYDDLHMGETM